MPPTTTPPDGPAPASAGERLDSWKQIATYLKREVRTVQRWEKSEGLPVHRHLHDKHGTVYAFPAELDGWWAGRRVQLEPESPVMAGPDSNSEAPGSITSGFGRTRWLAVAAAALALAAIAVIVSGWRGWRAEPDTGVAPMRSVAVLPLENLSDDPQQEYFADGMTEALIADLASIGELKVISRSSIMQYKGARKPLPQIAKELGVDAVVEGSVLRSGNRVRITAQLVRASTDSHLWAQTYEREFSDVVGLQGEVARAIAAEVHVQLTPQERTGLERSPRVSPEAYEAMLRGRYFLNKRTEDGFRRGLEHFTQAIDRDPTHAAAYAGLADSYILLGSGDYGAASPRDTMPKAKAAAMKALDIDETLSEAHTSLGFLHYVYDWDWPAAERQYKRALELKSGYATAHHWYALYLSAMRRFDEAIAAAQRARDLDPLSLIINTDLGLIFYRARQYDRAIEQYRKTLDMEPTFAAAHWEQGWYVQTKSFDRAIAELQQAATLARGGPVYAAALGHAYAVSGNAREARRILADLEQQSRRQYVLPNLLATIYAALGEHDQAFIWLEKAYEARSDYMIVLSIDPALDPLRKDPRFADLLRRMRLTR